MSTDLKALLAFVSAQNENFIRETSYYSDSQCTATEILSAHALVVDMEGCIEQPCQTVEGAGYYSRIVCRAETILAPVPHLWPKFYLYDTENCPSTELVDFFYSRPGVCYPINLRNDIVYITASCYQWGIGATICNDKCGGSDCFTVNGTETCSFFKFPFADAWVLGECPNAPNTAPNATPQTTNEPTTELPTSIPAVLILDSSAISIIAQISFVAVGLATALFLL
jgi:hypothetical protein